jgi:hypothetical protein
MIRSLMAGAALLAVLGGAHAHTRLAADLDVQPYLLDPSRDAAPPAPTSSDAETSEPQPPSTGEPPVYQAPAARSLASGGPTAAQGQPKAAPPPAEIRSPFRLIAQAAPPPQQERASGGISIWALVTFVFYLLAGTLAILLGSILVEVLDKALERPWDRSGADSDESATGDFPLAEFLNPRASASAYRREAEGLRAMKEALDAELASVRAQIERERKHAEAMENGKERP